MGYGQSAFRRAVELLVTKDSAVTDRLADAICTEILSLSREEIPRNPREVEQEMRERMARRGCEWRELQDEFGELNAEVTDSGRLTDPEAIRTSILAYPPSKASETARCVFEIHNLYAFNHPETRLIAVAEARDRLARLWLRIPMAERTEDHMLSFWAELHYDRAEVVNVRYRNVDPWQKVHGWLLQINRDNR